MRRAEKGTAFNLKVEFTRAKNGLWVAKIPELPGVTATAHTRKDARDAVEVLALKAIADRMAAKPKLIN